MENNTELVIHIGDHKAGASSIQLALKNAHNSAVRNIHYCISGRGRGRIGHHNLVHEIRRTKKYRAKQGGWKDLADELNSCKKSKAIISSENFEFLKPERLRDVLDKYIDVDYKIVIYIGPHLPRILASYAERTKAGGMNKSTDQFALDMISNGRLQYSDRIQKLEETFGVDRLIVRPYVSSALVGQDVLRDFCVHALNEDSRYLDQYITRKLDDPPSSKVLEIMRPYVAHLETDKYSNDPAMSFKEKLFARLSTELSPVYADDENETGFKTDTLSTLRDQYAEDAEKLDARLCAGDSLFVDSLFDDKYLNNIDDDELWGEKEKMLHEAYREVITTAVKKTEWYKQLTSSK